MRIIFCGSGTFATPSFLAVLEAGHDVAAVVTQPPRPAGRGGLARATPIELAAEERRLEVFPCENINLASSVDYLKKKKADLICVVEYGQFIRDPARRSARLGAINLHASILPELRGAAPVNWAILHGKNVTGVTTFQLVDRMDAGPVLQTARLDIAPEERAGELRLRLAELGALVILETLDRIANGKTSPAPQDDSQATFAPRLQKSDGFLDFRIPAQHIVWKVRGLWPWPGARAVFGHAQGKALPVTITQARVAPGAAEGPPGVIDEDLFVSTAEGRLEVAEIQPAGKKVMTWRDFVNGYRVSPGDVFYIADDRTKQEDKEQ